MKWKLIVSDFWTPIYYVLKFIGMCPLRFRDEIFQPSNLLDKLYPIALATIYMGISFAGTFIDWREVNKNLCLTKLFEKIAILYHSISYLAPSGILVTFVLRHKEIVCLMNKLRTFSEELKNFGIEENCGKLAKNLFAVSLIVHVLFDTMSVVVFSMEANWVVVSSIGHIIQEIIFLNVILIFANILTCVEQRCALLNEKLMDDTYQPVNRDARRSRHGDRIFVTDARAAGEEFTAFDRIRKMKAMHLKLCDIMNRTTRIFEVPILLLSCQFFFLLVVSCYWIYFNFFGSTGTCAARLPISLPYILCPLLRMLTVIFEMFFIADASRKVYMQGNAIQTHLHELWNVQKNDRKSEYEFVMFSLQLSQNPLTVSAFGFFDLDYSYLYKIFGAVLAYVIVSIQLDDSSE